MGKMIAIAALVLAVAGGVYAYRHYSGNQSKQTVDNTNGSPVFGSTAEAIQSALAQKYGKPTSDVHVTVSQEIQGFAKGTVSYGAGGPGEVGAWLAYQGNGWHVAWDGNGTPDCGALKNQYGIPDSICK